MFLAMLDMGQRKYGDMTFCRVGSKTFLVDGAHVGDEREVEEKDRVNGWKPVAEQLADVFGHQAPFDVDLLVVTHCHSDHIGCLPELVLSGVIKPKWALLADPRMGFGLPLDKPFPNKPNGKKQRVAAALREEPLADTASNEEVRLLIDTASSLQKRYHEMIERLEADRVHVVRYGRDAHLKLEQAFADTGFKILGPTVDQLLICALRVEREKSKFDEDTVTSTKADSGDEISLYRNLVKRIYCNADTSNDDVLTDDAFYEDGGTGAALNNQSIVIKLGHAPDAVLLTGDMQFASPSVGHLRGMMLELHEVIRNAGPYAFTRLSHHGAANGTDSKFLDYVAECSLFGISTGAGDVKHPSQQMLDLLSEREPKIEWARTDRNGLVTLTLDRDEKKWSLSRGKISEGDSHSVSDAKRKKAHRKVSSSSRSQTRDHSLQDADLPRLTFVTNLDQLRLRIGEAADAIPDELAAYGHRFVNVKEDIPPQEAAQMARGSNGLVLLGGYGVIPAISVDTVSKKVRRALDGRMVDNDNYVVWSDDPYGSPDGFVVPTIPVSRVPDELILGGVSGLFKRRVAGEGTFGLRNRNRPFASAIYSSFAGPHAMLQAVPTGPADIAHPMLDVARIYLMLHGHRDNAGVFSGEDIGCDEDEYTVLTEAFTLENIPEFCGATILAGCCYGAQLVRDEADGWGAEEFDEFLVSESIALSFLSAGAKAFVGCTGVHYSPADSSQMSVGGPMHQFFWDALSAGDSPAQALREAKLRYFLAMPFDDDDPKLAAAESKTLRQFTCLGLGW